MKFNDLGLSQLLCDAVTQIGYEQPTPIQEESIPHVLRGSDILASAQTGTGKTASFLLPMIDILLQGTRKARMPRAIVLEPARELAAQVLDNFNLYTKNLGLSAFSLVGGESMSRQEKILKQGVDVLIATPGRLLDLIERGQIILTDVKFIVIDEADRMLDMGFIPDVDQLMRHLPSPRQTLMFSATMPKEVQRLANCYMFMPRRIHAEQKQTTADTVKQYIVKIIEKNKREAVRHILRTFGSNNDEGVTKPSIIFCNRKRDIPTLVTSLKRHGFNAIGLHGDLHQSHRNDALDKFRDGTIPILVASDVAARGIDIDNLALVINFNVPMNSDDYVHRIGRTGRAGQDGVAFTLYDDKSEEKYWQYLQKIVKGNIEDYKFELPAVEKPKRVPKQAEVIKTDLILEKRSPRSRYENTAQKVAFQGFGDFVPAFFKSPALGWEMV